LRCGFISLRKNPKIFLPIIYIARSAMVKKIGYVKPDVRVSSAAISPRSLDHPVPINGNGLVNSDVT